MSIEAKMREIQSYVNQRLANNEAGVNLLSQGWKLYFNKRTTRAIGRCHYIKKQIEISTHFIPTLTEEEWKDTVNHEIAHALTRGTARDAHGPRWQQMAVLLGAKPEAMAELEEQPEGKYVIFYKDGDTLIKLTEVARKRKITKSSYVPRLKAQTLGKLQQVSMQEWKEMNK